MNCHRCMLPAAAVLAVLAAATPAAENREKVEGRIREVRPSAHQLLLQTREGKELTLQVDNRSRVEQNGREVGLDQLRAGTRVQVAFESRDGENRVVSLKAVPVSAEDVRKEIREAFQAAKAYSFQQKDDYRKKLQSVLDDVNARIDDLQHQAAQAEGEARKQYSRQIEQLRRLRDRVQDQAERVKSATPGAWEEIKSGVGSALEDLRKAFERAGEHFR